MRITGFRKSLKIDNLSLILIVVVFTFINYSCNQKIVSEDYQILKNSEWSQDSMLVFGLNIKDTTKIYNLSFNARNEAKYPYSNLWLFISIVPPSGKERKDTVELTLATPDGKWLGSGLGYLYERKYPYKQNIFFPEKGNYSVNVRQGMRTETGTLKGIHDFGICLERAW